MQSEDYAETLKRLKDLIYEQNTIIKKSTEDLRTMGFIADLDDLVKRLYISNAAIRKSVIMLDMYASTDSYELDPSHIDHTV